MSDLSELETLAKPLVEYLRINCHPHTAIVVTDERVAVVEDVLSVPFGGGTQSAENPPDKIDSFRQCGDNGWQIAADKVASGRSYGADSDCGDCIQNTLLRIRSILFVILFFIGFLNGTILYYVRTVLSRIG